MRFARLDIGNNVVEISPHRLPTFYNDGTWKHPVRVLWDQGDKAAVNALGWYEIVEMPPTFDSTLERWNGTFTYQKNASLVEASQGSVAMTAPEIAERLAGEKEEVVKLVKAEGLSRIKAFLPALATFDEVELIRELWLSISPAARAPTATLGSVTAVYQAGRDAVQAVNALATITEVRGYDPVNTPTWP